MKVKRKFSNFDKVVLMINIVAALALIFNYLVPGLETSDLWTLGTFVNIILILNILLFVYWLTKFKIYMFISLVSILAGIKLLIAGLPSNFDTSKITSYFQQNNETVYIGKNITVPDHPRLLLLAGEEAGVKQTILNPNANNIHQVILAESDKMLSAKTLQQARPGQSLLNVSRESLRRLFFLSYSWRITRQQKYLNQAKQELVNVCTFDDWNPSHFLDVAEMTTGVSIAYDWLYNDLSAGDKMLIKKAILTKGLEPSLDIRYNYWLKFDNNWVQVCNAGMIYGAIAIFEDNPEFAKKILNRSINSLKKGMNVYAPNGSYPEGYMYWLYGTTFNVMAIDALQKDFNSDFGLTAMPGFLKTAYYFENLIGPTGKSFNYSDATTGTDLNPDAAMLWFSKKLKDPSVLWTERAAILKINNNIAQTRVLPTAILWGGGINLLNVKQPVDNIWAGGGKNPVAMMRSSWDDPNAIFLGLKAGSASFGHGHMDAGSFVMEASGQRWALDLGMVDYSGQEARGVKIWDMSQNSSRWNILNYNNKSHNTLTVNDELQTVTANADINSVSRNPMYLSAITNLTSTYQTSLSNARRGVAIIDKKYVAIRDEFETSSSAADNSIKWAMVTAASVKIIDNSTAELIQNGKVLTLKVQQPANITLKVWPLNITSIEAPKATNYVIGFELNVPPNTKKSLTVLLIPKTANTVTVKTVAGLRNWPVSK